MNEEKLLKLIKIYGSLNFKLGYATIEERKEIEDNLVNTYAEIYKIINNI